MVVACVCAAHATTGWHGVARGYRNAQQVSWRRVMSRVCLRLILLNELALPYRSAWFHWIPGALVIPIVIDAFVQRPRHQRTPGSRLAH